MQMTVSNIFVSVIHAGVTQFASVYSSVRDYAGA